jgi:hypothetical protein
MLSCTEMQYSDLRVNKISSRENNGWVIPLTKHLLKHDGIGYVVGPLT